MQKQDTISGLFLLALSLFICIDAMKLQVGTLNAPGSGFFPLVSGAALGALSILIIVQARGERKTARFWMSGANKRGIYLTLAILLLYSLVLEKLGFLASTILLFMALSRFVSGHSWKTAVFFSLAVSLATHFLFSLVLRAPLPNGILERFL